MNIVPPVPVPTVFSAGTVNTEAVRRDNTQRETIPQLSANENSAAETGVGSESDKVRTPGQTPQPLTYEKPSVQSGQPLNQQNDAAKDNAQDESAGKESAEEQQQQQQAEQQQINELKQRDTEVRAHEQAHAAVGGQYAGAPQYEYERGPDGRQYAVEGEVSIDVSEESTPEETVRKAQQVKAAALAPAEPSAQDLRVANEASQIALEARAEIARENAESAQQAYDEAIPDFQETENVTDTDQTIDEAPDLDEIVDAMDISVPKRSLDNEQSENQNDDLLKTELDLDKVSQFMANRDLDITRRVSVIENFYQQAATPRAGGLSLSA